MSVYELKIRKRGARPRSERLRELGGEGIVSAGSTVVTVAGGNNAPTGNDHYHTNKAALDQITTDADGYQYLTRLKEGKDAEGNEVYEQVTEKVKAGYADKAAIADDLTPDSPVRSQFLSRLAADTAAGRITFEEGLHALTSSNFDGGIYVGDYTEGMEGANIDSEGNAEVESITARSYLKVYELIYNRINALEGNTSFADTGTIEAEANDGQLLTMRKRWEGDFTAFQPGDIVYGYVNDLEGTNGGQYYKAWARVQSVDRTANKLTVVYYPASETPAKVNYKLRRGMVITRWGNAIEANAVSWANEDYKAVIEKRDNGYFNTRQSNFFISCEDGNLVELMGVNKPILSAENYGTVLGRIPEGLLDSATDKLINKDQPYLYARGIIVQDLIRVDYRGVVTRVANYRGTWSAATAASETDYYRSTTGAYDTVTWNNCLWQCVASGTTDEPSDSTGSWVNMSGGAEVPKLSVWKIMPNTDIVTFRYDAEGNVTIEPKHVTCNVLLTDTEIGTKTYSSSLDLSTDYGVKLWYSIDGATWKEFVIGNTEPLETEYSEAFEAEASTADSPQYLTLGGDDVASELIGDRIYFELRNDSDVLARSVIPVVKDGKEGTDGIMVYPAGVYSADITYTADNETSPVVAYDGNYYMLIRGKSYNGATMPEGRRNPAEDVANGGDDVRWRLFEKFNAVFADVIMANFAKLGGAVFYGDYMFSQSGTINGTEVSGVDAEGKAYYRKFTDGVTYGTFLPYLMLNFQTGELNAEKGKFRGTIEALKGIIGGFDINEDSISYGDVSNTDLTAEGKALVSPRSIFIQDIDPDYNNSYYRVAFGRKSDPNNDNEYGCMGFIYKHDRSSDYYKAFYPALRIIANSNWGWTIGLSSKGAIVTEEGPISENGKIITVDSQVVTVERLEALEGSVWAIKNTIGNDENIYLPEVRNVKRILGNSSGSIVWRTKFTVLPTSYRVSIQVLDTSDNPDMYSGTSVVSSFTASPGKFYEAWLICDGTNKFWQIREI